MAGKYYDNEDVIGSSTKYHRASCPVVRNIERRNYKRLQSWKKAVELGLEPCGVCHPFGANKASATPAQKSSEPERPVTAADLADWRRAVAHLLARVDSGSAPPDETLGGRISRLSRAGIVPREVAAIMRAITEMRNVTEYESKQLSVAQGAVARSSWEAVREWAGTKGVKM